MEIWRQADRCLIASESNKATRLACKAAGVEHSVRIDEVRELRLI